MRAPIIFAIKLSVEFSHRTCYATASFLCIHRSLSERLPCGFIKSSAIVNNFKFMRTHTHHMCHTSGVKLCSVHPTEARLVCRRTCELWCKRRTKKKSLLVVIKHGSDFIFRAYAERTSARGNVCYTHPQKHTQTHTCTCAWQAEC